MGTILLSVGEVVEFNDPTQGGAVRQARIVSTTQGSEAEYIGRIGRGDLAREVIISGHNYLRTIASRV